MIPVGAEKTRVSVELMDGSRWIMDLAMLLRISYNIYIYITLYLYYRLYVECIYIYYNILYLIRWVELNQLTFHRGPNSTGIEPSRNHQLTSLHTLYGTQTLVFLSMGNLPFNS